MKIQHKILIGVAAVFSLFIVIAILSQNKSYKEAVLNEDGHGIVKLIRDAQEGRPVNYKIIELENGETFKISKSLVETVNIGDSVYKNKGEEFYTIVNYKTKESRKINE